MEIIRRISYYAGLQIVFQNLSDMMEIIRRISYYAGLQMIFQNLSDMMSGKNKILLNIYENLSDINFYKFLKTLKIQLLLRNISSLVYMSRIYTVRY